MAESTPLRYPVFVVGMPRSGTTLLSSMLDAHSKIAISPETHFYTRCQPDTQDREGAIDEALSRLQQQPGVQDMNLTEEEWREIEKHVWDAPAPTPSDVLAALETTYAKRFDADAWGEKTPDHLPHVPLLLRDFPDAVVIGIVRDPRDVWLSLREMPWCRSSLPEMALKWRKYAQATERYRRKHPDRFREVRYEDVLDAPEAVIRNVLNWIGASFEEQVLAFHRRESGPVDSDREPWKAKTHRPIDPTNKEKWRAEMTAGARFLVERITGETLNVKGYQRAMERPGLSDIGEILREVGTAAGVIARRKWRRWQMPKRQPGDYTPTWMREKAMLSERETEGGGPDYG